MALQVFDINRKEVERWISAGTLGLTNENCYFRVSSSDEYYLVALTAVFATRWDAIWVPNVIETTSSVEQVENWSRALDEEELAELCGNMVCHCIEIWHVVDETSSEDEGNQHYDYFYAMLYHDILPSRMLDAIKSYEYACSVLETSKDDNEVAYAREYITAFEHTYDIVRDSGSFYPVTTYRRKSDYALDLEELRLAGCVEHA